MGKISLGANEILRISLGTTEIKKVSLGLSEIWTPAFGDPKRMGVTRTTDYPATEPAGTYYELPGWSARSGFPDTALTTNKLDLPPGNYKVSSRIIHGYQYNRFGVRIKDAGGNILASAEDSYFNVFDLVNAPFTHPGGLLTIEVYTQSKFSGSEVIKAGSFVEVMPAAQPTLQGVLLSGTQQLNGNVYTLMTLSTLDPEHPGSTLFTNGVKIVGDGTVTVKCYARMSGANTSGNKFQMYKNGSPIGPEFLCNPAAQTEQWGGSFTHTFANNDVLQMYGYTDGAVSNRRQFTGDNTKANTYFELMP
jgi:hypothetical protein